MIVTPKISQDLLKVKIIFDFLSNKDLESQSLPGAAIEFSQDELNLITSQLLELNNSAEISIQKLSQLVRILKPKISRQEWLSLIIPVERALKKNPVDADFLISCEDNLTLQRTTFPLRLVLDSFRSAFNVGALFRSAECLGVEHLYLCGYTPTPEMEKVHKSALGTENQVSWSYHESTEKLLLELKSTYHLVALETSSQAKPLQDEFPKTPTVFILGNERFGLDPQTLQLCHEVRKIPLYGSKNSLNASTCGALAIYEWTQQWNS